MVSPFGFSAPWTRPAALEVLGSAHALLHLIDFDEPFGFSVVEAMACGTPVVAYDRGSMSELIDDAATGFIVHDADQAVHAIETVGALDRTAIRASAMERFSAATMVGKYVALYRSVLARPDAADRAGRR